MIFYQGDGQGQAFDKFIELQVEEGPVCCGTLWWHSHGEGKWDVKFMQDYNFKVSELEANTIQFGIDHGWV
jgi:hypothetical protein